MTEQDKTAGLGQFPALSERLGEGKLQMFREKGEVVVAEILDETFFFSFVSSIG